MTTPWMIRAGRVMYREVSKVFDHRTPQAIYSRYKRSQQRSGPVPPRPIRELVGQPDDQAAAARQRTAGAMFRVACAGGENPFGEGWLVLRSLAVASDWMDFSGHEFGFLCRAPPRPSTLCLRRSAADATGAIYAVQASHGDALVVSGTHPDRPPMYMVLDVAASTSIVLRGSFSHSPLGSVGVMRREHDVLVTAILHEEEQQQGEEPLEMMCLSTHWTRTSSASCDRVARAPYPEGAARPWGSDGSVTHGGSIFFVDYSSGLIRFEASPALLAPTSVRFVLFPGAGGGQYVRRVSSTQHNLVFSDMDDVGRLRTWKLIGTEQGQHWEQYANVGLHEMAAAARLPRPDRIAFVHPLDAHIIYLLISEADQRVIIVAADVEKSTMSMVCIVHDSAVASRLFTLALE